MWLPLIQTIHLSLFLIQTINYVTGPDPNHTPCHCSWSEPSTTWVALIQTIHYVTVSDPNHKLCDWPWSEPSTTWVALIQTIHYVIAPGPNHTLCHCSWSKPYTMSLLMVQTIHYVIVLIQTIYYVIAPDPIHTLLQLQTKTMLIIMPKSVPDQNRITTSRLLLIQAIHYVTGPDPNHNYTMSLALIQNHKVCHSSWSKPYTMPLPLIYTITMSLPLIQTTYYITAHDPNHTLCGVCHWPWSRQNLRSLSTVCASRVISVFGPLHGMAHLLTLRHKPSLDSFKSNPKTFLFPKTIDLPLPLLCCYLPPS